MIEIVSWRTCIPIPKMAIEETKIIIKQILNNNNNTYILKVQYSQYNKIQVQ